MAKKPNECAGGEGTPQTAVPDPSPPPIIDPQEAAAHAELLESLRKENEGLKAQVEVILAERDEAVREREALTQERDAARAAALAQRERHDASLMRVMRRAADKAQKGGDARTHQALEQVLVTLAEARHRVKEAAKVAKGDGLKLLEDLEDLLD